MNISQLIKDFKNIQKPTLLSGDPWEFDFSNKEIKELLDKDINDLTTEDFNGYLGLCTTGSIEELKYLLPGILKIWQNEIYTYDSNFIDSCHEELTRTKLLINYLEEPLKNSVYKFIQFSIIERCKKESIEPIQRSSAHSLYGHLASLGTFTTLIPTIWPQLWSKNSETLALFQLQYISILLYDKTDNPIFKPWTPNEGGGPPLLWGYSSLGINENWLDSNIDYLKKTLNIKFIEDKVNQLKNSINPDVSKMSNQMHNKLTDNQTKAKNRCARLIEIYEQPGAGFDTYEW